MNPTDQFHVLDEVQAFGNTEHGLIRFDPLLGPRRFVDGVPWPFQQFLTQGLAPLQLVRMPGIADVPLSAEYIAAERAAGRVWQNYALLLDDFRLFGQNIGGWLYFASNGVRWVIRPVSLPNATPGQPYSLTLNCSPFGYFGEAPAEPVNISLTLADTGQLGTGARSVSFQTINSNGSAAILRMRPALGSNPLNSGFLRIDVSDTDGVPTAQLSVHLTQDEVRGEWHTTHPEITSVLQLLQRRFLYPSATVSGAQDYEGLRIFPIGGGTVTVTYSGLVERDFVVFFESPSYNVGAFTITSGRRDRVLGMVFDDADELVTFAYETEYRYIVDMPSPSGTAAGSIQATAESEEGALIAVAGYPMNVITPPAASASRTISERLEKSVRLMRSGQAVYEITSAKHYSAHHSAELADTGGVAWCLASAGADGGPLDGFGRVQSNGNFSAAPLAVNLGAATAATTATAEHGGPWPRSWTTTPTSSLGRGLLQYTGEMPVGTDQRDADSIGLTFAPFSYQADYGRERFSLLQREQIGSNDEQREVALAWARAELIARGVVGAPSDAVAYHPLTHELATGDDGGFALTFI